MPKHLATCDLCNNIATWSYMPGSGYYCDLHVPRGCSCNVEEDGSEELDLNGKRLPCVEYDYCESGYYG